MWILLFHEKISHADILQQATGKGYLYVCILIVLITVYINVHAKWVTSSCLPQSRDSQWRPRCTWPRGRAPPPPSRRMQQTSAGVHRHRWTASWRSSTCSTGVAAPRTRSPQQPCHPPPDTSSWMTCRETSRTSSRWVGRGGPGTMSGDFTSA